MNMNIQQRPATRSLILCRNILMVLSPFLSYRVVKQRRRSLLLVGVALVAVRRFTLKVALGSFIKIMLIPRPQVPIAKSCVKQRRNILFNQVLFILRRLTRRVMHPLVTFRVN